MADDINVKVTAGSKDLKSGMDEASEAVHAGVTQMMTHLNGLGQSFKMVQGYLLGFTALLAGGGAFAEAISSTIEFESNVVSLARRMGVTTEEATNLEVALKMIGSSGEAFSSVLTRMARMMRTNEDGMNALGIKTRDANGHLLDANTVIQQGISEMMKYKPGIDQTAFAMQVFGRSVDEVMKLQLLTTEIQEEARKKVQELGLAVTAVEKRDLLAYRKGVAEVGDVMTAMSKAVGDVVIPELTKLMTWFSEFGPALVDIAKEGIAYFVDSLYTIASAFREVWTVAVLTLSPLRKLLDDTFGDKDGKIDWFKTSIESIRVTFVAFGLGLVVVAETIGLALRRVGNEFANMANFTTKILHGDWAGAMADWRASVIKTTDDNVETIGRIFKAVEEANKKIRGIITGEDKGRAPHEFVGPPEPPLGGDKTMGDLGKRKAIDKALLDLQKAKDQAAAALTKESLAEISAIVEDSYKQQRITIAQYYESKLQLALLSLDNEIDLKRKESEAVLEAQRATHAGSAEYIKLQTQQVKLTGEIAVLEAKRAAAVITNSRQMIEAEQKHAEALAKEAAAQTDALAKIGMESERAQAQQRFALRQISAEQLFEIEKGLQDREYELKKEAVLKERALWAENTDQYHKFTDDIEKLEADHQLKLLELANKEALEQQKIWTDLAKYEQDSFATMIDDVIGKHKSLLDAMKGFINSIMSEMSKLASADIAKRFMGPGTAGGGGGGAGAGGLFGLIGSLFGPQGAGNIPAGVFAEGTPYVPQDMIAMIHQGERVVPASENRPGGFGPQGPGSAINVVNNFNVPAETTYESRALIASNVGRSLQATRRNM